MNNYTVTNSNDSGEGSLREAIALANANEGLDVIDIQVENIELNSEIQINDSLDVTGNSVVITQATENQGIFFIDDGNDETFIDNSFVDLTLTGASSTFIGGAISTNENLNIDNVYFLNNSGTGVGGALQIALGTANIANSTFEGNSVIEDEEGNSLGAALFAEFGAVVNIDNSLFIGNSADRGTIETNQATLTITNSEIRDNSTRGIGLTDSRLDLSNVLIDNNEGQGIITIGTDATVKAATITNNSTDYSGGIGVVGFDVLVSDSLIENNTATISGGAISSGDFANLEISNSILRENTAPLGAALEAFEGGSIIVTDTYLVDNIGEDAISGENITFAGTNADNQNGVLPDGEIGYQAEGTIGYQLEEPVVEEPVVEEPVVEEPVVEEPVVEEPVVEEPVVEEPVVEEPVVEEPVVEEPVMEEPVVEEPVMEEPVVEEPVVEEPVVEEPVVEEPAVEEFVLQTLEITRSYQADTGVHMFTTGDDSIDGVEEQSFALLSSDVDELTGETIDGVEIIYQFLNSDTDAYLYTMDTNEVDYILENLDNYSLEGELYGFESEPQDIETIPIYRMLNTDSGTHMYVEGDELGRIQTNFDNFELEVKGEAAFYALEM